MQELDKPNTPGWPEIVIGLLVLTIVAIGGGLTLVKLRIDPVLLGIMLTALSGVGGLAGFVAAFFLRLRSWHAFGIRSATARWILIGVGVGVAAFVAKGAAIIAYTAFTGDNRTIQDVYATGASGGLGHALAATLFLAVLTPIGEEFLFRGVITSALRRYGALIGVGGGALVFALFHGINMIFPAALVTGLAAGELFRRSGSIWPAVTVHVVVNLPTIPVMLLTAAVR